jgi:hypothetical protein
VPDQDFVTAIIGGLIKGDVYFKKPSLDRASRLAQLDQFILHAELHTIELSRLTYHVGLKPGVRRACLSLLLAAHFLRNAFEPSFEQAVQRETSRTSQDHDQAKRNGQQVVLVPFAFLRAEPVHDKTVLPMHPGTRWGPQLRWSINIVFQKTIELLNG